VRALLRRFRALVSATAAADNAAAFASGVGGPRRPPPVSNRARAEAAVRAEERRLAARRLLPIVLKAGVKVHAKKIMDSLVRECGGQGA